MTSEFEILGLASSLSYARKERLVDELCKQLDEEANLAFRVPYPCRIGDHPFEMSLKNSTLKRYMRKGLMQCSKVYITICNSVIIRGVTMVDMQLDLVEHFYTADPKRISAAMIKVVGKKGKHPDPLYFYKQIQLLDGVVSEEVIEMIKKTGWKVVPLDKPETNPLFRYEE